MKIRLDHRLIAQMGFEMQHTQHTHTRMIYDIEIFPTLDACDMRDTIEIKGGKIKEPIDENNEIQSNEYGKEKKKKYTD